MTPAAAFLERLRQVAESAAAAESAYRHEASARIAILEQERAFAFRRSNLTQAIAEAVLWRPGDSVDEPAKVAEEIAVAGALGVLRTRLGWSSDSESRSVVLTGFAPVAVAIHRASWPSISAESSATQDDIAGALEAFERWYEDTYHVPFWTLFENEMPERPLVDF